MGLAKVSCISCCACTVCSNSIPRWLLLVGVIWGRQPSLWYGLHSDMMMVLHDCHLYSTMTCGIVYSMPWTAVETDPCILHMVGFPLARGCFGAPGKGEGQGVCWDQWQLFHSSKRMEEPTSALNLRSQVCFGLGVSNHLPGNVA